MKIKNFTDLFVWNEGHQFVLSLYRLTKSFPSDEQFSLTNQMRRAAVSITSNIAEGFGRRSYAEKRQFYNIASGSITEIQSQLYLARDLGYCPTDTWDQLNSKSEFVYKLLNALIASLPSSR